jgi:hypothetical protein
VNPLVDAAPRSLRTLVKREKLLFLPDSSSLTRVPEFRIAVPDVRVRVDVRLIETTAGAALGTANPNAFTNTLWASLCALDRKGNVLPVANLVGTAAAPLTVPTDSYLYGYHFRVENQGSDPGGLGQLYVVGQLSVTGDSSSDAVTWDCEVAWQASSPVTEAEWAAISSRCSLWTSAIAV